MLNFPPRPAPFTPTPAQPAPRFGLKPAAEQKTSVLLADQAPLSLDSSTASAMDAEPAQAPSARRSKIAIKTAKTVKAQPKRAFATPAPEDGAPAPFLHRVLGEKTRATAGILFQDILPPVMALGSLFTFAGGPLAWGLALSVLPLSYLSGKLGRHLSKGVAPENLPPGVRYIHEFKNALRHPDQLQEGEMVDRWNKIIDHFTDLKASRVQNWVGAGLRFARLDRNGAVAKFFNNKAFLAAKVSSNVAQADSVGGAFQAASKGGAQHIWWNYVLPGAGQAMQKAADFIPPSLGFLKAPFKGAGWLLDHLALLQFAKDGLSVAKG